MTDHLAEAQKRLCAAVVVVVVLVLVLVLVVVVVGGGGGGGGSGLWVVGSGLWVVVVLVLHTFHSFISHRPMALQYSVRWCRLQNPSPRRKSSPLYPAW